MVMSLNSAANKALIFLSMRDSLPIFNNGFGKFSVSGIILLPYPAARIIAFIKPLTPHVVLA